MSRATIATSWPPRTIRVTSIAGCQVSSPSRTMNAPTGRAVMLKPPPDPLPWPCGSSPLPAPAAPWTRAAGMMVRPSFSYGSPNTRLTVSASRAWAVTSCTSMSAPFARSCPSSLYPAGLRALPRAWDTRPMRARDLGITIGTGRPGPGNAITDVAGVRVGHATLVRGDAVRTGVDGAVPLADDPDTEPVFAGCHRLNGNGELTGLEWIRESGLLTSPVAITNTHSVGVVRDALIAARLARGPRSEDALEPAGGGGDLGRDPERHRRHARAPRARASRRSTRPRRDRSGRATSAGARA